MINNFWEEKNMSENIHAFHEMELQKMDLPKWVKLECPFCKKMLPLKSVRLIGLKLNTRNMGDLVIEVLCDDCSKMDTLYFRQEIFHILDFCRLLDGGKSPKNKPIIEEDMYKMQYNNVIEKMMKVGSNKQDNDQEKDNDAL